MDFERAAMLLHVADLSLKWPQLKPLHDAAVAELTVLQTPPEKEESAQEELKLPHEYRKFEDSNDRRR
jgi:hypothetical protein